MRAGLWAGACALAGHAAAADPAAPALPETGSFGSLLQVLLGLAVVMAVIGLAAWLARRFLPGGALAAGPVRVVGGVMVGPKERVVVLEIDTTWVVVGVTSTHVQALHTQPRPAGAESSRGTPARADDLLARWLSRRRGGDTVQPPAD